MKKVEILFRLLVKQVDAINNYIIKNIYIRTIFYFNKTKTNQNILNNSNQNKTLMKKKLS